MKNVVNDFKALSVSLRGFDCKGLEFEWLNTVRGAEYEKTVHPVKCIF